MLAGREFLGREVNDITTLRLKHALVAAGLTGLILGGAASAWGQSDGSSSSSDGSSSSQTTPAPANPGKGHSSANCPNMGGSSGSGSSSSPSAYSGA
jgi:hypothetical protein